MDTKIPVEKLIEWGFAMVVGAISTMVFLYSSFQTVGHADSDKREILDRLNRIEEKQDKMLERQIDLQKKLINGEY